MAIYTKISRNNIISIEKKFNLGKIISFKGIKKGIENTNYLIIQCIGSVGERE